uniref:Putative secreted protein n=1 Tax=Panstrongylus lignarius TaxID=156445 RepID=A0A224XYC4_9HEMI
MASVWSLCRTSPHQSVLLTEIFVILSCAQCLRIVLWGFVREYIRSILVNETGKDLKCLTNLLHLTVKLDAVYKRVLMVFEEPIRWQRPFDLATFY